MKDLEKQIDFLNLQYEIGDNWSRQNRCITITDGDAASARTLPHFRELCSTIDSYKTQADSNDMKVITGQVSCL